MLPQAVIQTELHRHLDVSLRTTTLLELAQARSLVPMSTSLESFRDQVILTQPLSNLDEVLETFRLFQKVLDRPSSLERLGFEATEDCYREGTRKIEFRFSPSFLTEKSRLSWEDALAALERGISRALAAYPEMKVGLICIASRDYGPDSAAETAAFFLKNRDRFIAIDLAGSESKFPCRLFQSAFRPVRESGARITIHAGEDAGPENIWQAIADLGAQRIGHGIRCVEDPQLMKLLRDREICLEVCPTSNWLTQAVKKLEKHPLPKILAAQIPVSINTDDPGVFGTTVLDELRICHEIIGLSSPEVALCLHSADRYSFIEK